MNVFEKQEDAKIFDLGIDEMSKAYLLEASRWTKFLAITGFILLGIWFVGIVMIFANISDISRQMGAMYGIGYSSGMLIAFLVGGGIFFYLNFAMLRFSTNVRHGLNTFNQSQLNTGLKYLKNMFKVWGICTILLLALYGLIIILAIVGVAMSS